MPPPDSVTSALTRFFSLHYKTKLFLRKGIDEFRIKEFWQHNKRKRLINNQTINVDLHNKFGSDIAVANFVLKYCLRGKVMLVDQPNKWIVRTDGVPLQINRTIKLLRIDCSYSNIVPEGIDNFVGLEHLKSLNLSGNDMLNDFACDQLARQFRASKTLEEINLSNIPLISISGVERLIRIPSLKRILIQDTWAAEYEHFKLFSMLAEDEQGCKIER